MIASSVERDILNYVSIRTRCIISLPDGGVTEQELSFGEGVSDLIKRLTEDSGDSTGRSFTDICWNRFNIYDDNLEVVDTVEKFEMATTWNAALHLIALPSWGTRACDSLTEENDFDGIDIQFKTKDRTYKFRTNRHFTVSYYQKVLSLMFELPLYQAWVHRNKIIKQNAQMRAFEDGDEIFVVAISASQHHILTMAAGDQRLTSKSDHSTSD